MNKHNLTSENYFSLENNMKYMGSSQFKDFTKCEYGALAKVKGEFKEEKSVALLVGSYVDAHFEGTLDLFIAKNPQILTQRGELRAEYKHANYIIQRMEQDDFFMQQMSGEKQVIMVGEIDGVPVKVKIDSYLPDVAINDLKCMKDFEPIWVPEQGKISFVEAWGYDIQGAIYQEIVYQNTGVKLPFNIIAVTKQKPEPDIDAFYFPQYILDSAMEVVKAQIKRFDLIKQGLIEPERCGTCNWCKHNKKLTKFRNVEELMNE